MARWGDGIDDIGSAVIQAVDKVFGLAGPALGRDVDRILDEGGGDEGVKAGAAGAALEGHAIGRQAPTRIEGPTVVIEPHRHGPTAVAG